MQRQKLTREQIGQYFDRLTLSPCDRRFDVSSMSDDSKLQFLEVLQRHQLVKVPWENLVQHYSWHGMVNVSIPHLFNKIVHNPGRGGYCMEANYLFHIFLFSLGFNTHMLGARIWHGIRYGGWTHNVTVVIIADQRYLLDGGYGPRGSIQALPIEDEIVRTQISPAEMRLAYQPIPDNLDSSQRLWVYYFRKNPHAEWTPQYCFADLEFTPADIEAMNFEPSCNRRSFFTHKVVVARFVADKDGETVLLSDSSKLDEALHEEITGSLTMDHDVLIARRTGGEKSVKRLKTEQERVNALQTYFGIRLSPDEQAAIFGSAAQLGGGTIGLGDQQE